MMRHAMRRAVDGLGYYLPALVVAVAVCFAVVLADMQKRQLEEEYLRSFTTEQLGRLQSRLQGNILGNIKLVQGLIATLSVEPDIAPEHFSELARRIFREDAQLRNLAIAPNMVVTLAYPLKGNERSIGLDYRKIEAQRAAALLVKERGQPLVTGPVELVQGGLGVIARYPLYKNEKDRETFRGIASAVIDLDELLTVSGFEDTDLPIAVSLSVSAHDGRPGGVFFETATPVDSAPVVTAINLGHDQWTLSASPLGGWNQVSGLGPFRLALAALGFIIVMPMFWVGYLMKDRHRHLLALKDREDRLETVSQRLQLALNASRVGVFEYDAETGTLSWDRRMRELYGVAREKQVCSYEDWRAALHPDDLETATQRFEQALEDKTPYITAFRVLSADGRTRHIRAHGITYRTPSGGNRMVGANWDVTEDIQLQAELLNAKLTAEAQNTALEDARLVLEHNALHDALTRLPNRRFLDQELALASNRGGDGPLTLLHIDLDRFKDINDTLGHAAGDEVLKNAAAVLRSHVPPEDFIARIGGDEFVLLSRRDPTVTDFSALATRIVRAINEPFTVAGHDCRIGASVGVATRNDTGETAEQLLVNADIALYEAKRRGRNCVESFNDELRLRTVEAKRLGDDILRGLERQEFEAFFQPQFDARTLEIVGVEALARWRHPTRGLIFPDVFLPVAENLNVVSRIDEAILNQALLQAMRWRAQGLDIPRVSVNVSCQRLRDETLTAKLRDMNIPTGLLTFELLESISFDSADASLKQAIEEIKALGIDIEIDDFGTGHASIVSLLELSPKRLKIDRRLILPLLESQAQQSLVSSILDIGRVRGIEIVAEGVETLAHAELLRRLGCHALQGYAFARPMPAEEFLLFAQSRSWLDEATPRFRAAGAT